MKKLFIILGLLGLVLYAEDAKMLSGEAVIVILMTGLYLPILVSRLIEIFKGRNGPLNIVMLLLLLMPVIIAAGTTFLDLNFATLAIATVVLAMMFTRILVRYYRSKNVYVGDLSHVDKKSAPTWIVIANSAFDFLDKKFGLAGVLVGIVISFFALTFVVYIITIPL